jgi:hypothetical protein
MSYKGACTPFIRSLGKESNKVFSEGFDEKFNFPTPFPSTPLVLVPEVVVVVFVLFAFVSFLVFSDSYL